MERREATTSLEAFCKRMDDRFVAYRHTKAVLHVLEAIAKRDLTKLVITMPPRAGKPLSIEALILLGDGTRKRLGDVVIGDSVITHTGKAQRVEAVFEQPGQRGVRIDTYAGRSTEAALDHPFWTPSGRFTLAGDLGVGQSVSVRSGINQPLESDTVKALTGIDSLDCRCLKVAIDHTFTADDFIVHNSYLSSERFPAFVMASVPRSKLMLVAYNSDLAQGFSRKARDLANEPTWPFEGVQVSQTLSAVGLWGMTNGSEMRAGGFGGTLSGAGASVLIIDDPVKNSEEANSATHREKIWEFYGTTVRTRAERGCAQIVMLTRWSTDDLAGRILNSPEGKQWHVLNLPAYALENDAIGRSVGEELWPEGPPIPNPADGVISKRFFEALYQQAPVLESGDLFKKEWLTNYYDRLPPLKRAAIFIDGAWKTGISNSRSAMQIYGDDGINFYLIDSWAARVEYPELKQAVKAFYIKHRDIAPTLFVCCEEAASGLGLVQELKRERFPRIPIVGVTVDKDKTTRAEATTSLWEAQRIFVPRVADFMFDFTNEMLRFPGEPNDLVDCMSGAITKLSKSGLSLIMGSLSTVRKR